MDFVTRVGGILLFLSREGELSGQFHVSVHTIKILVSRFYTHNTVSRFHTHNALLKIKKIAKKIPKKLLGLPGTFLSKFM
jgi:hypothetical protein